MAGGGLRGGRWRVAKAKAKVNGNDDTRLLHLVISQHDCGHIHYQLPSLAPRISLRIHDLSNGGIPAKRIDIPPTASVVKRQDMQ